MDSIIKISRIPYEEPYCLHLVIEATNGRCRGLTELYTDPETLLELAEALEAFPNNAQDSYVFELGSDNSKEPWLYYLKFKVFTTDSLGHCAIQLRLVNNGNYPYSELSEFCIFNVDPWSINQLGKLFRVFANLKHELLYWKRTGGQLYTYADECEITFP